MQPYKNYKNCHTWSVADVRHGATFGGDVAQVDLLGLDLDLWGSSRKHMLT